jgi:hypothetical protein
MTSFEFFFFNQESFLLFLKNPGVKSKQKIFMPDSKGAEKAPQFI